MKRIVCLLLILIGFESHGQFTYQFPIEGNVVDILNNPKPGCSVSLLRFSELQRGTVTNTNGFFELYGVQIGDEILIEYFNGDPLRFKIRDSFYHYLISLVPKNFDGYSRILEMRRDKFIINPVLTKESVSDKIIFTFPNARKYLNEPLRTNQEKQTIEAIISTNLKENELRNATKIYINGNLQTGKLGTVSLKAQQQDYDFEQIVMLEEGENKIEIVIAPPNQEPVRSIPLNVFYTPPLKANLYLFTFGIESDLNYTDEDALAVHRIFKSQEGKASDTETSIEDEKWQNGSFTEALIEALEGGKADYDNDKKNMVSELFKYLEKRVPELVKSIKKYENKSQNPKITKEFIDFPIYLVK